MRLLAVAPLLVALCGCAGPRSTFPEERPASAVVVAQADVARPPGARAGEVELAAELPEDVLVREAEQELQRRGWNVVAAHPVHGPPSELYASAAELAAGAGAEAALVVRLVRWNKNAVEGLAGEEPDMEFELSLVGADGAVLWEDPEDTNFAAPPYRSGEDWRAYLRQAVQRLLATHL